MALRMYIMDQPADGLIGKLEAPFTGQRERELQMIDLDLGGVIN